MTKGTWLRPVGFAIVLFAACAACVWRAVSGAVNPFHPTSLATVEGRRTAAPLKQSRISKNRAQPPKGFAVIPQRNLFRSFVKREEHSQTQALPPPSSLPPMPPSPPLPSLPLSPSPPDDSGPEKDKVTVVGVVWSNGEAQVLVEDFGRGAAQYIRVGESAFGYRVVQVTEDGAVLERNGREFHLALGQGKSDVPVLGIGGEHVVAAEQWGRLREEWERRREQQGNSRE